MNRTSIEWAKWTWNPITGCSQIGCPLGILCYARNMAFRLRGRYGYPLDEPFRPTFHDNRLYEPYDVKQPAKIFVCSMGEIFDEKIPHKYIQTIFEVMRRAHWHTFLILTKQSINLRFYTFPPNVWLGVSVTSFGDLYRIKHLQAAKATLKFVSFEPLLSPLGCLGSEPLDLGGIDWVIIGALTGHYPFLPPNEWIRDLAIQAQEWGAKVFEKDNLRLFEQFKLKPLRQIPETS